MTRLCRSLPLMTDCCPIILIFLLTAMMAVFSSVPTMASTGISRRQNGCSPIRKETDLPVLKPNQMQFIKPHQGRSGLELQTELQESNYPGWDPKGWSLLHISW